MSEEKDQSELKGVPPADNGGIRAGGTNPPAPEDKRPEPTPPPPPPPAEHGKKK